MTSIKQEFLDEMRNGSKKLEIKARLMLALKKSDQSIDNYIDSNNPLLTTKDALAVICEELGKSEQEILTA